MPQVLSKLLIHWACSTQGLRANLQNPEICVDTHKYLAEISNNLREIEKVSQYRATPMKPLQGNPKFTLTQGSSATSLGATLGWII